MSNSLAEQKNFNNKLYEYGLFYLENGLSIVPGRIKNGKKGSYIKWSRYQNQKPTKEELIEWIENWPDMGWAIVAGRISKIIVLDVDPDDGGLNTIKKKDLNLPPTVAVKTGGGGMHYYYRYPVRFKEIKSFVGKELPEEFRLPGLDLRADGGLVYAPPSPHPSGERYGFYDSLTFGKQELAEVPEWLLDYIEKNRRRKKQESAKSNIRRRTIYIESREELANLELIQRKQAEKLQERLNPNRTVVEVDGWDELKDFVYTQNIADFLGFAGGLGRFRGPFHDDTDPSANIYRRENGHYIYKCFGACGFVGNIIDVVQEINPDMSRLDVLEFLKDIYGITITGKWYRKVKKTIQKNRMLLNDPDFKMKYPYLARLIWRFNNLKKDRNRAELILKTASRYSGFMPTKRSGKFFMHPNYCNQLLLLHNICEDCMWENDLTRNGDRIFFASVRYIARRIKKIFGVSPHVEKICQRNNLFALLGLIEKIDPKELPERYLFRSQKIQRKNNHQYMINYFLIPPYNKKLLERADSEAEIFDKNGGTMKGFGYEFVYRTYGEKRANQAFPQLKGKKTNDRVERFYKLAEKVLLERIEQYTYCTEKQILNDPRMENNYHANRRKLKSCIGQLISENDLVQVQTNKDIKEMCGMEEFSKRSFPKVLIPKEDADRLDL